jgi:hypothetical protein
MVMNLFRVSVALWFTCCMLARAADATPAATALLKKDATAQQAREMRDKLARAVTFLDHGVDAGTKLQDAVEFISEKSGVPIVIDKQAFRTNLAIDNVEEQPVTLPKLKSIKLGTIFRMLSASIGGTYLVLPDHVLITTTPVARPDQWTNDATSQEPTVDVQYDKRPLGEALQEMSDATGINIVLDVRVGEGAKIPVTATLSNVPISSGVRMLADMANLDSVTLKGALYVTTQENAERLRAQEKTKPPPAEKPMQ